MPNDGKLLMGENKIIYSSSLRGDHKLSPEYHKFLLNGNQIYHARSLKLNRI